MGPILNKPPFYCSVTIFWPWTAKENTECVWMCHLQNVTDSPGSAGGSWLSRSRCCSRGDRWRCCVSGSAFLCERWPQSDPGWRHPQACPAPPLSFLTHTHKKKTLSVLLFQSDVQCCFFLLFFFKKNILTVGSGRVSLLLVCAQKHGESRIRHMKALQKKKKTESLKITHFYMVYTCDAELSRTCNGKLQLMEKQIIVTMFQFEAKYTPKNCALTLLGHAGYCPQVRDSFYVFSHTPLTSIIWNLHSQNSRSQWVQS